MKGCSAPGLMPRIVTVVVIIIIAGQCFSLNHRHQHAFVDDHVQNYLMRFGYLPQSDIETGNLRTEDQLIEAIKTLQRFANLNATGVIDRETHTLLDRPRCGLPDWAIETSQRRKRYTLQGQTWPYTNLTWSLRSKNPENLDSYEVRSVLSHALDLWAQHSKLTFRELDSDDADILIYFWKGYHNDGYAFDGKGKILAHAFFPGTGRGGDVHFDEEEQWLTHDVVDNEEGTSLFAVAAHEFGHSLGLSHSSVPGALMYPWYEGIKANELPEDDRHGIQQMYGSKEDKLWANIIPRIPEITTTTERSHHHHPDRHPSRPPERYPDRYPERYPSHYPDKPPKKDPRYPSGKYPYSGKYPKYHPQRPTTEPERTTTIRPYYPHNWPGYDVPRRPEIPESRPTHRPQPPERNPVTRRVRPSVRHKHRNHIPREPPDKCNMSYDAIAIIRNEVFIFKNEYLWRLGENGLYEGYPAQIIRMWNDLPANLSYVDAVYERPDRKIVFFIDKMYYLYTGNRVERGYPRPLTDLGLPESLERIDGAMVWGHNGKTYLYSGTMYWRLDEETGQVELDYPRDMSMWKGVSHNIDTVFQWKDGKTYFFKGLGFWKFNDMRMRVENEQQSLSAPFWMGCGDTQEKLRPVEVPLIADKTFSSHASQTIYPHILLCVIITMASTFFLALLR